MRAHRTPSTTAAVVALAFLSLLGTGTHTVRRGETLSGIAVAHGMTTAALAAANGITDPDRIVAGTRLRIQAAEPAAPRGDAHYTVRRGDTLATIAAAHGTTAAALVGLNSIGNPNLIRIGQVLTVPATGGRPDASVLRPIPATPSRTPARGATAHVVRRGDTISGIARTYAITHEQLIAANGLTDERIYVGQRLRLVVAPEALLDPTSEAQRTHTVRSGETLSDIAQQYGVTLGALRAANEITDPDRIVVGAELVIPAVAPAGRNLVCPIRGAMRHMNDWGFPRSGGRFHEGNDLFAARGTPVVAIVAGWAIHTVGRIGGKQVKLEGDDDVTYFYTHLDSFGDAGRVAAGQVIGTVGTSGNAAGSSPHVHFEAHPAGGAAINPYPRLAAIC